ncbi:MAG: MBL fold metallo-hydrolase [Bacteroidota bacterium]
MLLKVLGCGDAFGNGERYNTAFLLTHEEEHVLLDCGTSTLFRLKEEGVELEKISTIVLSHFHGDHFGGVPFFLIASLFEQERKNPLRIIGPPGVQERVLALQEIMYPGTAKELETLSIDFIEYDERRTLEVGEISLQAYAVKHSLQSRPHGYKLNWGEKIVSFSGDTAMCENLFELANEADLFICECNFLWGENFGHLSYQELFQVKDRLSCKQLYLSHMNDEVLNAPSLAIKRLFTGQEISL